MGRKKCKGYIFITWETDHAPYHVHIYKGESYIGRWDIENQSIMKSDDFKINDSLKKALIELGFMFKED